MIQEFEQALANGGDLDTARSVLIQRADTCRLQRIEEIERSFKEAQLVRFGLEQPRESPAYGVAMGAIRWYRKQYPKLDDTLVREIRKDIWAADHPERSEQ